MPLNNKEYWEKRALLREQASFQNATEAEKKLIKYYLLSGKEIRSKIADLYARYARDNKVSYAQAMEMLSVSKTNEWRYSIEEYVEKIEELKEANPVKAQILLTELNKLSSNARISRLAALTAQIDAELGILALKQEAVTENTIKSTFEDTYYKTLFDFQQGAGYATSFSMLDAIAVTSALNYPWSGLSYSERIWANRDQLSRELKQEITTGLIKGASIREMAEAIDGKTDKGYKNAVRLVRTEVNYFENAATMDGYKECDIDQYQYLATLDSRTSTICQGLDLKIFNVIDAMPGMNMPPMHPHCRSTTVPYIPDDIEVSSTRIARNKDGKNIHVPADMTYKEWYNEYVRLENQ